MAISSVEIENLRCLKDVKWQPASGLNVITGANGAGKTSVLEAVVLAGSGRALRPGSARGAINHGSDLVRVKMKWGSGLEAGALVYERGATTRIWAVDGEKVRSPLTVYERLPLLILNPETHYGTLQEPQIRRAAIHWLMFHVEPLFLEAWRRYQRILRQRNAALKNKDSTYRVFDPGFIQSGQVLAGFWAQAVQALQKPFQQIADQLHLGLSVDMVLKPGSRGETLSEGLEIARRGDEQLGYTQAGPHRADIHFLVDNRPIQQVASHGQQKIIVSAWRLALASAVGKTKVNLVVLIDDLAAELDRERREAFYDLLLAQNMQSFVTAIEAETFPSPASMFHVEHGQLRALA